MNLYLSSSANVWVCVLMCFGCYTQSNLCSPVTHTWYFSQPRVIIINLKQTLDVRQENIWLSRSSYKPFNTLSLFLLFVIIVAATTYQFVVDCFYHCALDWWQWYLLQTTNLPRTISFRRFRTYETNGPSGDFAFSTNRCCVRRESPNRSKKARSTYSVSTSFLFKYYYCFVWFAILLCVDVNFILLLSFLLRFCWCVALLSLWSTNRYRLTWRLCVDAVCFLSVLIFSFSAHDEFISNNKIQFASLTHSKHA